MARFVYLCSHVKGFASVVTTSRLLKTAGSLAVGALALSACSINPGAAAVVDGNRITENVLATTDEQISPMLTEDPEPARVLQLLIAAPDLLQVTSENGIAYSDEQAREVLEATAAAQGVPVADYTEDTLRVTRMILAQGDLSQSPDGQAMLDDANARLASSEIVVSPRYGEWDAETNGIAAVTPDWILAPEAPVAG
ncbi:hypothetical protein EXU48_10900 [Occultella glacieicola]|uniref:SurA N-terminal domain-containing protein n=1 Tax=Occultella glacieicola TaxID=2518684 RepID=A0ABY2E428_9MICO|nr:hypothetical protein [Occultella glacieicola]TDE93963.1 hypothetical protein EXU48_10900 [Occultella glacieicola]